MTTTIIHEQTAPSATTETVVYTVPALKFAIINNYSVCNRGATATTARVSFSKSGGATATKDYNIYDLLIPPNDVYEATCGFTLGAGTVIRVYAGNASLSFQFFGKEDT